MARRSTTTAVWVMERRQEKVEQDVQDETGGVVTIVDESTGTSAKVLTSVGFNCFSFMPVLGGRTYDLIYAEEGFGPRSELSLHGIPLLFPYAGRLQGRSFEYRGETYEVTGGIVAGDNIIHGFVISRPWRVVAQEADTVTGEFQASVDDPSLLEQWPADFLVRVTYCVQGTGLLCEVTVENPDEEPLPFGFGTHPYFRMPFGPDAPLGRSVITIPADRVWTHAGGLPTGEIAEVWTDQDFRDGTPFDEVSWDGVLTGLNVEEDSLVHTTIADPAAGLVIDQAFAPEFDNVVVWVPPHRRAIAVEPWTTVPNAFQLAGEVDDTGLITLQPGESWATRIMITLRDT